MSTHDAAEKVQKCLDLKAEKDKKTEENPSRRRERLRVTEKLIEKQRQKQ